MSYILTPILVRLADVRSAVGSRDAHLAERLVRSLSGELLRLDRDDEDYADEGEPPVPTMAEAVRQLVSGGPYDARVAFKYGYALECLCRERGETLPNGTWSAMGWDWVETVDAALDQAGVPVAAVRVTYHLLCRGAPVPLPHIDDFPSIGYLSCAEAWTAAEALAERLPAVEDDEVRASLEEVSRWLQRCVHTGRDLVCFYA